MNSTTIYFNVFDASGNPADADTLPIFRDEALTFGIVRADSGAAVVAMGTSLIRDLQGSYHYTINDSAPGLVYDYSIEFVLDGETNWVQGSKAGSTAATIAGSGFDAMMMADMAAMTSSTAEFSEPAIYIKSNGTKRPINVILDRNPPQRPDELERGFIPALAFEISNNAAGGIAATEFVAGGDVLRITRRAGADITDSTQTQDVVLYEPYTQDVASMTFRIGRGGKR